jgi:hypothetical protein
LPARAVRVRAERFLREIARGGIDDGRLGTQAAPPARRDVVGEAVEHDACDERGDRRHGEGILGVSASCEELTGQRRPVRLGVDARSLDAVKAGP